MAVAVSDVRKWIVDRGIHHVLMRSEYGWCITACGIMTPAEVVDAKEPKKVCRKCRAALARVRKAT